LKTETKPKYQDEEWLREQYWAKEKGTREIAETCKVSKRTVLDWLHRLDIEVRNFSKDNDAKYKDKGWLRKQYWGKGEGLPRVAEKCDVSPGTISYWLKKYNIRVRGYKEANQKRVDEERNIKTKYRNKDWLKKKYLSEKKSCKEVGKICGIGESSVRYWLHKFNIKSRTKSEVVELWSKEKYKDNKYRDREFLISEYKEKEKSMRQIAKEINTDAQTIWEWLKKYNIETRGHADHLRKDAQNIKDGKKKCSKCGKWLELDDFFIASNTSTGLTHSCKSCQAKYVREKHQNDPQYKLNDNFSGAIYKALRDDKNGYHWENLVPYNLEDLKEHLENQFEDGMTWDNYGDWHIDHIIPKSHFDFTDPEDEEFQECWALENLQPLWAEENLKKSDKLI